jgi:carbon monoxide dehydrogenase subunit G
MQIQGERRIAAPRERVWEALNDPDVLRACIPGCEDLKRLSDNQFEGRVTAKVGPVKATFGGIATLSDVHPPEGYTLTGEGKGAAGFAKGSAIVKLREEGMVTILTYEASAQVGGRLAQVGGRLIEGTTRKLSDAFFDRFAEQIGAAPAAEPVAPTPQPTTPTPAVQPATPEPAAHPQETPAPRPEAAPVSPPVAAPIPPAGAATPAPSSTTALHTQGHAEAATRPSPRADDSPAEKGLSPRVWIIAIVAIVLLMLWMFGSFG